MRKKPNAQKIKLKIIPPKATAPTYFTEPKWPINPRSTIASNGMVMLVTILGMARRRIRRFSNDLLLRLQRWGFLPRRHGEHGETRRYSFTFSDGSIIFKAIRLYRNYSPDRQNFSSVSLCPQCLRGFLFYNSTKNHNSL